MKKILLYFILSIFVKNMNCQVLQWTSLANPDSNQVNAVSFATNDTKIISATNCHPAHIRLWNSINGAMQWDYQVPSSLMCIMGAGISADNKYLVAVEEMGNILVFDNTTLTPDSINLISMGTSYAFAIQIAPHSQKMVVGASNGKLQCYRISDGAQLFNVAAHSSWVTAVQYSSTGEKIASGGNDNKIKIWDSIGNLILTLNGHTDDITALRFSSTNDTLWSSSLDNTIRIWNLNNGTLLQTLSVSNADVSAMDYSKANHTLATCSKDKWIRFFNASTLKIKDSILQAHNSEPTCVAFSTNGSQIVTGTSNGLVTKYNVSTLLSYQSHKDKNKHLVCYPNPCVGYLYIQSSLSLSDFIISDLFGKKILEGKINSHHRIDLQGMKPGLYFIETKDNFNTIYRSKIQIQ